MPTPPSAALDARGIVVVVVFAIVSFLCIVPVYVPLPLRVSACLRRAQDRLRTWLDLPGPDERSHGAPQLGEPPVELDEVAKPSTDTTPTVASDGASASPSAPGAPARVWLPLTHTTAPVLGVLVLLMGTCIGGAEVRAGIAGDGGVLPYDVIALFLSLGYIALSLDTSGLLRYLACHVCRCAAFNGRMLYIMLYLFLWLAGVVLGNDPVILSGTAFLVYVTRVAGITPPSAWVWAQFVAANIASAVLVSSNPTNLVIATGFDVSFVTYTAYMVLPSFAAALAALAVLLLYFRTLRVRTGSGVGARTSMLAARLNGLPTNEAHTYVFIPQHIHSPEIEPRMLLTDPFGAVFSSIAMIAVLAALIGTSVGGGIEVYQIGIPGAVLCFARDVAADLHAYRRSTVPAVPKQGIVRRLLRIFPSTTATLRRLPLALVPFAFGMFILVQGLAHAGFVTIMAAGVVKVCAHGVAATTFFLAFLSMVLCNVRRLTDPVRRHQHRRYDLADARDAGRCLPRYPCTCSTGPADQGGDVRRGVRIEPRRARWHVCR